MLNKTSTSYLLKTTYTTFHESHRPRHSPCPLIWIQRHYWVCLRSYVCWNWSKRTECHLRKSQQTKIYIQDPKISRKNWAYACRNGRKQWNHLDWRSYCQQTQNYLENEKRRASVKYVRVNDSKFYHEGWRNLRLWSFPQDQRRLPIARPHSVSFLRLGHQRGQFSRRHGEGRSLRLRLAVKTLAPHETLRTAQINLLPRLYRIKPNIKSQPHNRRPEQEVTLVDNSKKYPRLQKRKWAR